jgi:hypothetical protein
MLFQVQVTVMLLHGPVKSNETQLYANNKSKSWWTCCFLQEHVQQHPFISLHLPMCGMLHFQM